MAGIALLKVALVAATFFAGVYFAALAVLTTDVSDGVAW
jgi:hypothetical protein